MNKITINADQGRQTISRHIYGHFAEHLGRCIYDGVWVGEDSSIPNTRGMRNDIIEALRGLNIPNLRWPGGCFADEYHWMDGIGPREQRPTLVNTHWGGVTENNHFGTHEFLDLCDLLGCEPYICGNVGSGSVQEMQQWVEYITFGGVNPMADLRRDHGRDEPWPLRYWGVGNENWGCGGSMTAEFYADQYRRYQTYVRSFGDEPIYKIACGAADGDYHWTETLMRAARGRGGRLLMDGLSLHYYTFGGERRPRLSATDFDESEWFEVMQAALHMRELVERHSTIMDQYDPEKQVGLIIDEWGTWYAVEAGTNPRFLYQQNSLRDALVAAVTLDIFNQHADRVHMANIAQTINVLQAMVLTDGEQMLLTPTYHVFEMYKVHQDATLLPMDLRSDAYRHGDSEIPAVSASASVDGSGQINLTVSNSDPNCSLEVTCEVRGRKVVEASGRVLTAATVYAHNTFDEPETVRPLPFTAVTLAEQRLTIQLPAKSVVALSLSAGSQITNP